MVSVSGGRTQGLEKRNVFSLELNTATDKSGISGSGLAHLRLRSRLKVTVYAWAKVLRGIQLSAKGAMFAGGANVVHSG